MAHIQAVLVSGNVQNLLFIPNNYLVAAEEVPVTVEYVSSVVVQDIQVPATLTKAAAITTAAGVITAAVAAANGGVVPNRRAPGTEGCVAHLEAAYQTQVRQWEVQSQIAVAQGKAAPRAPPAPDFSAAF